MTKTDYIKYIDKAHAFEKLDKQIDVLKELANISHDTVSILLRGRNVQPNLTQEERDRISQVFSDAVARLEKSMEDL